MINWLFLINLIFNIFIFLFIALRARRMGYSGCLWFIIAALPGVPFFFLLGLLAALPNRSVEEKRRQDMMLLEQLLEHKLIEDDSLEMSVPQQTIGEENTAQNRKLVFPVLARNLVPQPVREINAQEGKPSILAVIGIVIGVTALLIIGFDLGLNGLATYHNFRCNRYLRSGQAGLAIQECDKALTIKPDFATVYINRGGAYLQWGNYAQAIADYNQAMTIDPNLQDTSLPFIGVAYMSSGEIDKGLGILDQAIEQNPDNAMAYFFRGWVYFDRKETDKAIVDLETAINIGLPSDVKQNAEILLNELR